MKVLLRYVAAGLIFVVAANTSYARVTGDPLKIEGGDVEGVWKQNASVRAYLGVPYAAPPVGALRWEEPQAILPWKGVYKADHQPSMCMQTLRTPGTISIEVYGNQNLPMSEDCLYLNVWTPANIPHGEKLPVFFWIHGGAFTSGSAAKPEFNGELLAKKGMVVVSINYRLNIFGFFGHLELTKNSRNKTSGNYGMLDQVAALQWAKNNIAAFGGDPDKITLGGQSAGSMSVNAIMASNLSKGLFRGAIAQSGGVPIKETKPLAKAEKEGERFTAALGNQSIEDLKAIPADVLLSLAVDAKARFGGPVVDGYYLKKGVGEIWEAGEQAKVPYFVGWSQNEFFENIYDRTVAGFEDQAKTTVGSEHILELKKLYDVVDDQSATSARIGFTRDGFFGLETWNAAALQSKAGQPTYLYYWNQPSPFWSGQSFQENSPASMLGAYHGSQVPYLFGTLDILDREFTDVDRRLSDLWQRYVTNFVKTGDPNGEELMSWPQFDSKSELVLELGPDIKEMKLPNKSQMEFFRNNPTR
ncbi:carboxylesterase/lipase family protein [Agrobacterium fabrum]|uniref:carboxylesterase/lipase family protein n=1 Tax=Agrobacterium fabrum TaxID=1176649 RepID=UPI001571AC37|nr:carboxylesterase family protein [Agrobacterium fabrum]WIE30930.1 carboxylesterase family protein [Agrobacterium fabrum]WIE46877.1 carboxylesterase family protein [Agrobacterium fabrum]